MGGDRIAHALARLGTPHGQPRPGPALDHRSECIGPQPRPTRRPSARPRRRAPRQPARPCHRRRALGARARRGAPRQQPGAALPPDGDCHRASPRVEASEIEIADSLLEIDYGAWDGLTPDECRRRDPELRAAWELDPFATACPGGESGSDVAARIATVLDPLEAWLSEDHARIAIVVAHNHVNRIRLCALFGWPMREYRDRMAQQPGGYSIVGFGAGRPVVRRLNAAPG